MGNKIEIEQIRTSSYTHRLLARIVIQTESPLAIASGNKNFETDSLVVRDVNGLPFIPATSIAGVLRHALGEDVARNYFGYQIPYDKTNGKGSEISFTSGHMIGKEGKVIDGIQKIDFTDSFYSSFKELPIRQHVRINAHGVAEKNGKFDEQVVFKGVRFCFEMELASQTQDTTYLSNLLKQMNHVSFRLGGGIRNGLGELRTISCQQCTLDLTKKTDLTHYLNKSSNLSDDTFWQAFPQNSEHKDMNKENIAGWTNYQLMLQPDDFFLFGSGFGDDQANIIPLTETIITWPDNIHPQREEECILIPASSIKGALAHRIAYYYNKANGRYVDGENNNPPLIGVENPAVTTLFGLVNQNDATIKKRGNVILSDIIVKRGKELNKVLNHVSIDRFTGGAINSALFQEKSIYGTESSYQMDLFVKDEVINDNPQIKDAFEAALTDICVGMLPLGGGVNRGNGCFKGSFSIFSPNNKKQ